MKTLSIVVATSIILVGDSFGARGNPETDRAAAARLNARGFALLHKACELVPGGTAFVSPYGIDSALGLSWLAAEGKTKDEIANGLGFPEDCRETFRWLREELASTGEAQLSSANALWTAPSIRVGDDVARDMASCFGGEAREIDFTREGEAVKAINAFVSDRTHGMIAGAVDSIDAKTKLMLVNTLHFKARWLTVFEKEKTHPEKYTLGDGSSKSVWMMHDKRRVSYFQSRDAKAIFLPYKEQRFQFAVILPNETGRMGKVLTQLANGEFTNAVQNARREEVVISLPRINVECKTDLGEILPALGMRAPFDRNAAQFPGWKNEKGDPLCIQRAMHVTRLSVDEVATEAAGFTYFGYYAMSIPRTFTVNRPFIVAIYDLKTQLVLFAGVINDPGSDAEERKLHGKVGRARLEAEQDKARLEAALKEYAAQKDLNLYDRGIHVWRLVHGAANQIEIKRYLGRDPYEIEKSFDKEWEEAEAMDPEIAILEKKASALRHVVYEWESKQYRKEMPTVGVTIRAEVDKMARPPDIAKAEKELKELEGKISEVRIEGDKRAAVLEKYYRLLADELLNKINEYIKGLGADETEEETERADEEPSSQPVESESGSKRGNRLDFSIPPEDDSGKRVLPGVKYGSCHCEGYNIVTNGDRIESVAGFKFGSSPETNGVTDVVLKLDKPMRDFFTMIHLGYCSNRLHTVTFVGRSEEVLEDPVETMVRAREELEKVGFEDWKVDFHFGFPRINAYEWHGPLNSIGIFVARPVEFLGPKVIAVTFVDKSVKEYVGEVEIRHTTGRKGRDLKYATHNLREIRGIGFGKPYYFYCLLPGDLGFYSIQTRYPGYEAVNWDDIPVTIVAKDAQKQTKDGLERARKDRDFISKAMREFGDIKSKDLFNGFYELRQYLFKVERIEYERYTGQKCSEVREDFEYEWEKLETADPVVANLKKRREELLNAVNKWLLKEHGRRDRQSLFWVVEGKSDSFPRPPEIARLEKEKKEVEEEIGKVRGPNDRRKDLLCEYYKMVGEDLLKKIDEYIKNLGPNKAGKEDPFSR